MKFTKVIFFGVLMLSQLFFYGCEPEQQIEPVGLVVENADKDKNTEEDAAKKIRPWCVESVDVIVCSSYIEVDFQMLSSCFLSCHRGPYFHVYAYNTDTGTTRYLGIASQVGGSNSLNYTLMNNNGASNWVDGNYTFIAGGSPIDPWPCANPNDCTEAGANECNNKFFVGNVFDGCTPGGGPVCC